MLRIGHYISQLQLYLENRRVRHEWILLAVGAGGLLLSFLAFLFAYQPYFNPFSNRDGQTTEFVSMSEVASGVGGYLSRLEPDRAPLPPVKEFLLGLRAEPPGHRILLLNAFTPEQSWEIAGLAGRTTFASWAYHVDNSQHDIEVFDKTLNAEVLRIHGIKYIYLQKKFHFYAALWPDESSFRKKFERLSSGLRRQAYVKEIHDFGDVIIYELNEIPEPEESRHVLFVGGNTHALERAPVDTDDTVLTAVDPLDRESDKFGSVDKVIFYRNDREDYAAWLVADEYDIRLEPFLNIRESVLGAFRKPEKSFYPQSTFWYRYTVLIGIKGWAAEFTRPLPLVLPGGEGLVDTDMRLDSNGESMLLVYAMNERSGCTGRVVVENSDHEKLGSVEIKNNGEAFKWYPLPLKLGVNDVDVRVRLINDKCQKLDNRIYVSRMASVPRAVYQQHLDQVDKQLANVSVVHID